MEIYAPLWNGYFRPALLLVFAQKVAVVMLSGAVLFTFRTGAAGLLHVGGGGYQPIDGRFDCGGV